MIAADLDHAEAKRLVLMRELARCRPWLEPAISHGADSCWEEVESLVLAGRAQLWPGEASALVTDVGESPRGRYVNSWLVGGDLTEILGAIQPEAEGYARSIGCTVARLNGRKGWERALAPHGYDLKSVILWKALS